MNTENVNQNCNILSALTNELDLCRFEIVYRESNPKSSPVYFSHMSLNQVICYSLEVEELIVDVIENMKKMLKRFPNFSVLAGADPLLLPLLQAGG